MSAPSVEGLRVAARSLAVALSRFECAVAGTGLDEYRDAKEDLLSAARCVVLAESSLMLAGSTRQEVPDGLPGL
jgi:hypothetical protein